jgi:hypothetical protein
MAQTCGTGCAMLVMEKFIMRTKRTASLAIAVACFALASGLHLQGQERLVAPVITAVEPRSPLAGTEPQTLTITGSNFLAGVSLNVTEPDGRKRTIEGNAILARRETSFQVAIVLAAPGAYTLTATNPDRGTSDQYVVKVQATAQPARVTPKIDRVLPENITKDPQPQILKISGQNFVQGLSVSVTDPVGTVYQFKGTSLGALTATSFDLSVALEMVGDYSLMVTNPTGESSNNVTFKVTMRTTPSARLRRDW